MKISLTTLAKSYLLCFGLVNYTHVSSLLGILSAISPPPYPSSWWWHAVLFLTYMILPIAAALADNYAIYVTVAGASVVRMLAEALMPLSWPMGLNLILAPLCALAAIVSLFLAVENVASKVSSEILSLQWSQF